MTFVARAPVLLTAAALVWGCAVYDQDLRSNEDGLGTGATGSGAGNGGGPSTGGAMASGGAGGSTAGTGAGGSGATGGTDVSPEGGSGAEAGETSVGGEDSGGTGGSSAGTGGTGGTSSGGSGGKVSTGGGGSGGSGGSAPVAKCSEHPLTAKSDWMASGWPTALGNGMESDGLYNPAFHVLDGSLNERWSTGRTQMGGEWLQIDFGDEVSVKQIALMLLSESGGNGGDYPRAYEIRLSNAAPMMDGSPDFTPAVRASGVGVPDANLVLNFPTPISGRYLSVRQTGAITVGTGWWTVTEVNASCTD